jgi:5-amino-6-(5-phosphoribosylamino)uracil reductase
MAERPYTLLSCGMSIDGYIDQAGAERLLLSNAEDLDRVDAERAAADAILVGAATVRKDNPRLLVRAEHRRRERVARGLPPSPDKVTVTGSSYLDPQSWFFTEGGGGRLVCCGSDVVLLRYALSDRFQPDCAGGHR